MSKHTKSFKNVIKLFLFGAVISSLTLVSCKKTVVLTHGTVESSELDPYWTEVTTETGSAVDSIDAQPQEEEASLTPVEDTDTYTLRTMVIDVGQGSAMLCESQGRYVLIDAGRDETHTQNVIAILQRLGVTEIDLVIATHYDYDHIGQLPAIIKNFKINNFLSAGYTADTQSYQMLMDYIERYSVTTYAPSCGDTFQFGGCTITVNGPVGGYSYEDENQNSISVVISDGQNAIYNGGDTTLDGENAILGSGADIDVDVYICNHHGSSSSSGERFLQALSPDYTIISVGKDNDYGHPTQKVLTALNSVGTKILRTDQEGDITFFFDGYGNVIFE